MRQKLEEWYQAISHMASRGAQSVYPLGPVSFQSAPAVSIVFDGQMLLRKGHRARSFELKVNGTITKEK